MGPSGAYVRQAAKGCVFKDGRMLVLYKPAAARARSAVPDRVEDLPGGCVEEGESLEEALVREIQEETGLTVAVGARFHAAVMETPVRLVEEVDFVCRWASGEVRLSWEHEAFEWLSLEELRAKGWEQQPVYERAFQEAGIS